MLGFYLGLQLGVLFPSSKCPGTAMTPNAHYMLIVELQDIPQTYGLA